MVSFLDNCFLLYSFFEDNFNLWHLLLIIVFYHQIKTSIVFFIYIRIESQIFYSIIRNFTCWSNSNPQHTLTLICKTSYLLSRINFLTILNFINAWRIRMQYIRTHWGNTTYPKAQASLNWILSYQCF